MRLRRARYMTLIELFISMGLLSILISVVFGIYSQISKIDQMFSQNRQETFRIRHAQTRLWDVLTHTIEHTQDKTKFPFFTKSLNTAHASGMSLVFVRDNGPVINSNLSNAVLSRLYVDDKKKLSLATWQLPKKNQEEATAVTIEVLLEGVEGLDFDFYIPLAQLDSDPDRPSPSSDHSESWEKDYHQLPVSITVKVARSKGETLVFAVPIPNSGLVPTYPRD